MKRILCVCLLVMGLFGCAGDGGEMEQAMCLRSAVLQAQSCSFSLQMVADYGDMTYEFSMDCVADSMGNVHFTVTAPETIAGITGNLTADGGNLTFDDTVLYIPMLTDDQITPVSAPWLLMKTLRSGCITSCADGRVTIDDSYADDALKLDIFLDEGGMPKTVEIYWKNRRILVLTVTSFVLS